MAVKIIKNKPVYTRQAAIEIDIFQTLQEEGRQAKQAASSNGSGRSSGGSGGSSSGGGVSCPDYMVNLELYFMHENHLCLVFELLGQNLYDVLKRRQFRGLPMVMVQDIVRQVLEGCRDLSQKSVVHCDLKPENILLMSEEASNRVVTTGDARSLQSYGSGDNDHNSAAATTVETKNN